VGSVADCVKAIAVAGDVISDKGAPMTATLRTATDADVEALLDLWSNATHPSVSDDHASLLTLLSRDPEAIVVAVDQSGNVIGSVIAGFDGWRGAIYRLSVDPKWRRQGLATRLLDAAEDRFRVLGARRSHAIVISTEDQAMAFWRSSTWTAERSRARFVQDLPDTVP
jgi:ribosomal protein S18 acetylase RimI-like enzyme